MYTKNVNLALLTLRVALAMMMLVFVASKVFHFGGFWGLEKNLAMAAHYGISKSWVYAGIIVQTVAAIGILFGIYTRFSAFLAEILIVGVGVFSYLKMGIMMRHMEVSTQIVIASLFLIILSVMVTLILTGGGKYSLDAKFKHARLKK